MILYDVVSLINIMWSNFCCFTVVPACFLLILLLKNQLFYTYSLLLAVGVLFISYACNQTFVHGYLNYHRNISTADSKSYRLPIYYYSKEIAAVILPQLILAFCYNCLTEDLFCKKSSLLPQSSNYKVVRLHTYLFFLLSVIFVLLKVPTRYIETLPIISSALPAIEFITWLLGDYSILINLMKEMIDQTKFLVHNFGLVGFFWLQWERVHIPTILSVFWMVRAASQSVYFLFQNDMKQSGIFHILEEVLVLGTDSVLSLFALASIVSFVAKSLGRTVAKIIDANEPNDDCLGTLSAVLFFILSFQSGIGRFSTRVANHVGLLCHNVCILCITLLHFLHTSVHPVLLKVSTVTGFTGNDSTRRKHFQLLGICSILLFFPSFFLLYIWKQDFTSSWYILIVTFCLELIIKVLVSLILSALFLIDSRSDRLWEAFDDYVYYVTSSGTALEILFGVGLFGNGAWILFYESGSFLRALMIAMHAYFNIWSQSKTRMEVVCET